MSNYRTIGKYIDVGLISGAAMFGSFFLGIVHTVNRMQWVEGERFDSGCIVIWKK